MYLNQHLGVKVIRKYYTLSSSSVMPVTCNDIIMLSARVYDATGLIPAVGYIPRWEQITGSPVTWLESQDQVDVMFQQSATRDDKIFRFYVDKGTVNQKTVDVLVTAVPTDILKIVAVNPVLSTSLVITDVDLACSLVPTTVGAELFDTNKVDMMVSLGFSKSVVFKWPLLLLVYKTFMGVPTLVQSIEMYDSYAGTLFIKGLDTNTSYFCMVVANGNKYTSNVVSFVKDSIHNPVTVWHDIVLNADTVVASGVNPLIDATITEVLRTKLVLLELQDTVNPLTNNPDPQSKVTEVITRQLFTVDVPQDTLYLLSNNPPNQALVTQVVAYQYSSLG